MAGKRKGKTKSGKRVARRVGAGEEPKAKQKKQKAAPVQEEEKPRITERLQEKDAGFGVIKVVIGVIVVLILAAGALSRIYNNEESLRGDKLQGEACGRTDECKKGMVCLAYRDDPKRCLVTCRGESKCEAGSTCISAAKRSGRKKTGMVPVCIEDSRIKPGEE